VRPEAEHHSQTAGPDAPRGLRIVVVFDDLLLGSNVLGMLRAAGHDAELQGADARPVGAQVMIVDLAAQTFDGVALVERLRAAGDLKDTRTIGVYSHVDAETRNRAEAAGFDLVVPRSRMSREGAALVQRFAG
jgi:CheY-like chemotaxis protein